MGALEIITPQYESTIQHASDIKPPKTSLIDSNKLVIAGGSFSQVVTITYNTPVGSFHGLDMLRSAISISAMHDARQRFPTLKYIGDTFANIKETILGWSTQINQPAILCFTGGPKSSTSAMAHYIAETLSSRGSLAGTFFFERDKFQNDGDFFLTLAYQIAINIPGMDNLVNKAVLRDPTILQKRGEVQLTKLILEPLFCLPTPETPFIIVVDEFDQCGLFAAQREIISLLSRASLTFGNTLRFVIFARRVGLSAIIDKNIYHWVGRQISLEDNTLRYSPLCSSQLTNQFFDPFPSSADSINDMWVTTSLIRSGSTDSPSLLQAQLRDSRPVPVYTAPYCNAFPSSALPESQTNIIGNSVIVSATGHRQGSPMSVDLVRHSPHRTAGSPMVIDSLRSSPRYGGSPMLIDSIYLSQQSGVDFESASQFNAMHQGELRTSNSILYNMSATGLGESVKQAWFKHIRGSVVDAQHAIDFKPYTAIGEEDFKAPTPELSISASSPNPSPESNHEAEASRHALPATIFPDIKSEDAAVCGSAGKRRYRQGYLPSRPIAWN